TRASKPPISTGTSATASPESEIDLSSGALVPTEGKDGGKGFVRVGAEDSTQVWAVSTVSSSTKITEEYDALALMQSCGVPTVLAGKLSSVKTDSGTTTKGFPMNWIPKGLSSNSDRDSFLAQLEKLSDARLAAARKDLEVIERFLVKYYVRDFQA